MFKDIAKIFGFGEQYIKWLEGRPQRLKDKALEAADLYIELCEHRTYKGRPVGILEAHKLKQHELKRFNAWKDGV